VTRFSAKAYRVHSVIEGVEIIVARVHPELAAMEPSAGSLSRAERERAARFRFDADRRRFIVAHSTLRQLLGARCGALPESLRLEPGKDGKPLLAGSRLQFSLSRSGELAAYAFAWGRAVGIDVEAIRPLAAADAIAARAFPRRERGGYAALAARDNVRGFFRSWTRTEALAKALGGGLTLSPEALDAALEDHWVVRSFSPAPGFAGAVACSRRGLCQ
jgi:4'-phosphopantetheinyl transferase